MVNFTILCFQNDLQSYCYDVIDYKYKGQHVERIYPMSTKNSFLFGLMIIAVVFIFSNPNVQAQENSQFNAEIKVCIDSMPCFNSNAVFFGVNQATNSQASSAGGRTAARADFENIGITRNPDYFSPNLFQLCAEGSLLKNAVIEISNRTIEDGSDSFMKITLSNVMIANYRIASKIDDIPEEEIYFDYGKVCMLVVDNITKEEKENCWDLSRNAAE